MKTMNDKKIESNKSFTNTEQNLKLSFIVYKFSDAKYGELYNSKNSNFNHKNSYL